MQRKPRVCSCYDTDRMSGGGCFTPIYLEVATMVTLNGFIAFVSLVVGIIGATVGIIGVVIEIVTLATRDKE